ncbi:N-acetyllactosaminide 3-alpha-galactosyltransferase [Ancylostoma ceylanicum]|uniref:Hexosyltransferase n=1 Tax=Ancylostoma ceylanicum TaxID=53326 RepID=A0A0D6LJV3_9BILA|nr:N-acetyllactosaminide 3-alpha-galactosyltransferase [Ancylostoma ceylanicum]
MQQRLHSGYALEGHHQDCREPRWLLPCLGLKIRPCCDVIELGENIFNGDHYYDVNRLNLDLFAHYGDNKTYMDEILHPYRYLIVPDIARVRHSSITVLVLSSVGDFHTREQWRLTYANVENKEKYNYNVVFLCGLAKEPYINDKIKVEGETYGDILQADFIDSYRNISIKILSGFRFISILSEGLKAVIRMDDDMNWRVANVTDFIHTTVKPEKKAFYCERFLTMEEYPYAELPTYCRGGSYIATMPAVHHVLQNVHSSRFLWFGYTAIFCVGTSHDPSDESRLLDEALDYGDILQADFVDSYRNLTIKMLTAIRYVVIAAREAKSVFKVDDDVSWRIRSVTAYIHNVVNSKACSFHCYRHEAGGAPPRNKWRKWYTTVEEYPFKTLPTYCLGWSYIATLPALDAVLSRVHLERFLWLEDVFISGVLNQNVAEVVGIDKRRYFRNKSDFRLFPKAWFYHLQHRNITIERGYTILNKSY